MERRKANLALFCVAVLWGAAFIAQGIAGRHRLALLFNGASFLLASAVLLPLVPKAPSQPGKRRWMLAAGLVLFAGTALQQVGILSTQVANAGFLTSLYAVITPFLLWLLFKEPPHALDLGAVTIAGAGAYLLSTAGNGIVLEPGDTIVAAGSVFWALHFVILGKFASRYESISFAAGQFFVAGLLNLAAGLYFEDARLLLDPQVIEATLFRAVLSVGVGYTLQVWGQKHTPATDAALILGLEAVFAAVAGWAGLGQALLPIQILGCGLLFVGSLLPQLKDSTALGNPTAAPLPSAPAPPASGG